MHILEAVFLLGVFVTVTGEKGQRFGSCTTDDECPGDAFCAMWNGCFMGICVCSEDPKEAFSCLWKKAGDTCIKDESKDECNGPPTECMEGKCSCPVNQSPTKHSNLWCDGYMKVGRQCDENIVLGRGESCQNGTVACWTGFREDPYTGECRSGKPDEPCTKNEECETNKCTSSKCACAEEMVVASERIRYFWGNGYNVSTVKKCIPVNAPSSAVAVGASCGGYLTCQGSTCMECPEGGVNVCVDLSKVGTTTNLASGNFPPSLIFLVLLIIGNMA